MTLIVAQLCHKYDLSKKSYDFRQEYNIILLLGRVSSMLVLHLRCVMVASIIDGF